MLALKLKNDLLLLMKNFKIILFFLNKEFQKFLTTKFRYRKKILFKHTVDIHTYIDMHELRTL